jgi:hypothetical protein
MKHEHDSGGRSNADRRTVLRKGSAIALAGVVGLSGTAAGQGDCDVLVDASGGGDATTVQGGVDAASPGDTVCVADGTYTEHVHVSKDLTLTNAEGASPTVEIPADPPNYTIPESGNTWEVVIFVGPETGTSTVDVDVSGIEVDGKDQQPNARVAAGLLLRNVDGSVEDVDVVDMAVGGKQTGGIAIYGDADVAVHGNTVDGYERFGIVANGDGGAHPAPTADVRDNDVTGSGDGSQTAWGPDGIQIGFGAEGDVRDNTVDRNRYSPDSQVASGIIVFESDGVTVKGNTVTESDAALTCGTWAWFRQTADGNRFVGNDVDGAIAGAHLESIAWDGFSADDPTLRNTRIVNNEFTQGDTGENPDSDSVGVELQTADADPDYDATLDNTKVIRNDIEGFATEIEDGGTDTKARANAFEP